MKKILSLSVISAALALTVPVFADQQTPTTVCVIQVAKVLHEAPQVQKDVEKLKAQFKKDQESIQKNQAALEKAMQDLKKNEAVMSPADKDKAGKSIADQRQKVIKQAADFQQKLSTAQKGMMDVVFKDLNGVIQTVAKTKNCNVVLDSQFVLYAMPGQDVTSDVQKEFNKP